MHFSNEAKSEIFFKKERTEQAGITGWTFIIWSWNVSPKVGKNFSYDVNNVCVASGYT